MSKFQIKLVAQNATMAQMQKINRAISIAEYFVNSENFKTWFMSYKFTQLEQSEQTAGKSNEFLYGMLMDIAEFNYYIERRPWIKRWSSVIGWEDTKGVHTYQNSFDAMSDQELAAHLVHEATHSLGMSHTFNNVIGRERSLPYAIGNYVSSLRFPPAA